MAYFVKVIPPNKRARVHTGECKFCRDGQGMENQDKGTGPTYWYPCYPNPGLETLASAKEYMASLGLRYDNTGLCTYCMREEI
ncbi:hypothetical protein DFR48_109150 [Ciceribacter lividus]|uniref:Uncharacterized protein n=1 Tax=Ciceribacter lividus TaxID=1197950 RepID=A0A6I7HL75_9HYPH|nr:hypothetical protein DFR48_109150 [Ciceribacter lividus]